ncbi:MAG: hypothetical protein Q4F67_12220, partial [Propionibacteriaceae bacterium]|nr:hypothetical protein [Propionibacteriaceae bacterium]
RDDMLGRDDRDRQDPTLARGGEHYADQQAQDARVAGGQQADQQRGTLGAGDVQDDSDHEREMLDRERDRERSLNERGGGRPRLRRYSPGQQ